MTYFVLVSIRDAESWSGRHHPPPSSERPAHWARYFSNTEPSLWGRSYAPCSPWIGRCSGLLRRKALRGHSSINLFLAGDKIAATTRGAFDESFIDNTVARLLASGAKTPGGNLDCLTIFLMEDDRHIVICTLHLCHGHRLSPRSGARVLGGVCVLGGATSEC
jgi:hypothetical protein